MRGRVHACVQNQLGLSRQGYYQWLAEPFCQRDWDDAHLINAAFDAHAEDPGFAYRFIADELADQGFFASENRVWRLCSMQGTFSIHSKKRGLNRKAGPPVHDDLLVTIDRHGRPGRDFTATKPNEKWLTDITEHHTRSTALWAGPSLPGEGCSAVGRAALRPA